MRVEIKPAGKYKPLFESESAAEISVWLDTNAEWRNSSRDRDGSYQRRTAQMMEIVITSKQAALNEMDDSDNVPMKWRECSDSRSLCARYVRDGEGELGND
jgi:hypothetical protein